MNGPQKQKEHAQTTIEFTFSIICVCLLLIGMIKVFVWTGKDLISRRQQDKAVLIESVCSNNSNCIYRQIRPLFFTSANIEATVNSHIFGEQYSF